MKQNYQDVAKGAIGFTTKKRTEVRVIHVTTGPTQMMLGHISIGQRIGQRAT